MPVEKSGQDEFDFQYGDDFGEHIEQFDPHFSKVLVRYNPDGDAEMNERQLGRLKQLADWLHANDRLFLFELLVPAEPTTSSSRSAATPTATTPSCARADAARDRGDPGLRHRGRHLEDRGRRRAARTPRCSPTRRAQGEGREGVVCVLLGRGASDEKVDHWLRQAAPVEGFVGFAIGRSIWWDALKGFLDGCLEREAAAEQIADNYLRFVKVYDDAEARRSRLALSPCWRSPAARSRRRRSRPPAWCGWSTATRSASSRTAARSGALHRRRHARVGQARHAGRVLRQGGERAPTRAGRGRAGAAGRATSRQRDRYGRLLAYVYRERDGLFVNAELVRARLRDAADVPAERRARRRVRRLAPRARGAIGRGLWSVCR